MKHSIRKVLENIRLKRELRLDAFEKLRKIEKNAQTPLSENGKIKIGGVGFRSDDEIWRTTEKGNKIMLNESGVVTGGNAYAVQKMKAAGAKVAAGVKTKKTTPKKEPEEISESKSHETTVASEGLQKRLDNLPEDVREKHEAAKKLSEEFYKRGREMAEDYPQLRSYTDHNSTHIEQVCEKTLAAADTIDDCLANDPTYGKIDRAEALVAARLHDIGMDGDTTKNYEGTDGTQLRKDHASNSAMNILENREALEKAGIDADKIALYTFAHSKSSSGMSDLNDDKCWDAAFAKMDEFVKMHNERDQNENGGQNQIHFDRSKFDDPEIRASAKSTIAALRFGDANRDAPEGDANMTQGGGVISVDTSKYDRNVDYGSAAAEREMFEASATYPDGRVEHSGTEHFDTSKYSAGVYVGEGNLATINCVKGKNGEVTEEFQVKDATMAPHCTFAAINERLGEMATATGIPRAAVIRMPAGISDADVDRIAAMYKSDLEESRKDVYKKTGKDPYAEIHVTVVTESGREVVL